MNSPEGTISILVIDDEAAIRDTFGDFFEDCGYRVIKSADGATGLRMFQEQKPDLVLTDLRMPVMDGIQVVSEISRSSPLTPVIVVSGTGKIEDAIEAVKKGAWDFILKPVRDLELLQHTINKALDRAILLSEKQAYEQYLETEIQSRTRELQESKNNLLEVNERLRLIVETTRDLAFFPDAKKLSRRLLEEFSRHMEAESGSLYFVEDDELKLMDSLDAGHAGDIIHLPLKEESLFKHALEKGEPILIRDNTDLKKFAPRGWREYNDSSAIIFPLPDRNGNIHALIALHNKTSPPFTDQDKEIGSILASFSCEALRATIATEKLLESRNKYQLLAENLKDVVIAIKPDGTLTYVSPAIKEFGHYDPEQAVKTNIRHFFKEPGEYKRAMELVDLMRSTHQSISYEFLFQPRESPPFHVEISAKPIIEDGRMISIQCVLRDVTERKLGEQEKSKLETQLQRAQKMEAIGTLAGGIAHDFNNILGAIMGYTQISLFSSDVAKIHKNLTNVLTATDRAKILIKQILEFSRQSDKELLPTSVASIIGETMRLLDASIPSTIEKHYRIEPGLDKVIANFGQIQQVLLNLCVNAQHAMEEDGNGVLEISATKVFIKSDDPECLQGLNHGPYVCISVHDTGCGMDDETIEKIFDPYFTTKDIGKGTGLGLSVAYGIVKSHNGIITVESKRGKGTTFHIFLPAIHHENHDAETADISFQRGTERVIFVDDEEMLVDSGTMLLETLGYDAVGASSGEEALEIFKSDPDNFDLIITDQTMPHMTGEMLAKKIMAIRPDIPIVICTGFSENVDAQQAESPNILALLLKPISLGDLAETLRRVIDQGTA